MVGAAAPTDDVEVRQSLLQRAIVARECHWIPRVQLFGPVKLGVALLGRVGTHAPDPGTPAATLFEHVRKVRGMGAVDHEICDGSPGPRIDFLDCFSQRLTAR